MPYNVTHWSKSSMRKRQMTNESSRCSTHILTFKNVNVFKTYPSFLHSFLFLSILPSSIFLSSNNGNKRMLLLLFLFEFNEDFPISLLFNMRSVHRAVSARLPCAEAPQAVLVVLMDVRPRLRLLPGSARHRTAVWPRAY